MKLMTHGVVLLDVNSRHIRDPFVNPKPEGKQPASESQIEVEFVKANEPNRYIVKLRVTIDTPKSLYVITVCHAVLLQADFDEGEEPPENFEHRLMITGATMAYPFSREVVSSITGRGRFGTIWLGPQDFNQLFPEPAEVEAESVESTE